MYAETVIQVSMMILACFHEYYQINKYNDVKGVEIMINVYIVSYYPICSCQDL